MKGKFKEHSRHSTVRIKDIKLFKNRPVVEKTFGAFEPVTPAPGDIEVVQYWKLSHGDLITHKDHNRKVIKFKGDAGWKGGYIPYVNTQDYQFMNLKVRNLRPRTSGFYFELKREEDALFGDKIWVTIPGDSEWHVIQVKIPKDDGQEITRTVNYLALSDPIGDFELSSITFSNEEIAPPETARAAGRSPHGRRRIPAIFLRKPVQDTVDI